MFSIEILYSSIMFKVSLVLEKSMEVAMRNFMKAGYKGVTETWNVLQHEVWSIVEYSLQIIHPWS